MNIFGGFCNFIWQNKRYILVFLFSMLVLVFFGFSRNTFDSIWNYGFSFAMTRGQVPYRDFTMIVPPLYNFVMAIGLKLFSTNNVVFLIEQSILITIIFCFLYKMFKEKAWIFLAVMCFPLFVAFCPTYNFFLFFLFVIILYLEKNNKNDYLIGLFLAFMVLTKYTVGFFFLIPGIIVFFKDRKKLLRRLVGFLIPCFIFLIYLLVTKSFIQFIDLCFLGLFDFGKENTIFLTPFFFISLVMFIISILFVVKDRNNIIYWYILFSFSVMLPIFTRYHFYVYMLFFSILLISQDFKISGRFIKNISLLICLITVIFNFFLTGAYKNIERFKGINNFQFYYTLNGSKDSFLEADKLYDKYLKKGNLIVLATNTSFLKIVNEDDFTYFTVLNKGNYGYNGTKKLIKKISKMNDYYCMIFMDDYYIVKKNKSFNYDKSQFDYEVVDYIMAQGEKVEESNGYFIYYIN